MAWIPKPLSKEMIVSAVSKTKSNRAAARFLGVSYNHYKRYAKLYKNEDGKSYFEAHLNPHGIGIPKFLTKKGLVGDIMDVIEGRISIDHFTPQKIRDKLIVEGYLKQECYRCGMHEYRVTDNKYPLILNWKDKNKRNFSLNNIELLCYNCFFLLVSDIFTEKQMIHMEDTIPATFKSQEVDWGNMDEHFEKHFKKLGLIPKEEDKPIDGSEYISKM